MARSLLTFDGRDRIGRIQDGRMAHIVHGVAVTTQAGKCLCCGWSRQLRALRNAKLEGPRVRLIDKRAKL